MESKACKHFTLRLSYSNPEHMRILGILESLDFGTHKSKNQFVIDAIIHYQEYLKDQSIKSELTDKGEILVTRNELDKTLGDFKQVIKVELYEDLLKTIVGFKMTPAAVADYKNEKSNMVNEENEEADDASQNLSRFNDVMDSVMNWSEDN